MYSTISPRVCRVAISLASTSGSPGSASLIALRISTRLMESMPRSPSRVISSPSISAGYPVFSATTCISSALRSMPALGAAGAAGATTALPPMYSTISPRVWSVAISPASTSGSPGSASLIALRISTRLMESMPRSPSRVISSPSISAGYPVFSATTCISSALRSMPCFGAGAGAAMTAGAAATGATGAGTGGGAA